MLRGTDTPTTVTERLDAANSRLDDLARAQARGTREVSNEAGHKMLLNAQNPNPLLVASGGNAQIDSALGFQSGTLQVVSQDGQNWRDIEASGIVLHDTLTTPGTTIGPDGVATSGDVASDGEVNATRITSTGAIRGNSADIAGQINGQGVTATQLTGTAVNAGTGGVFSTGTVQTPGQLRGASTTVYDVYGINSTQTYNMTANGNVTLAGRAWNAVVSVVDTLYNWWEALPSGTDLKQGFAEVDDTDADALLAAPVHRWSWAPWLEEETLPPEALGPANLVDRRPDQREHYGPVAEDVPEIMQVLNPEGRLGIDLHSYAGLLLRICQRQEQQIKDLTDRAEALETGKGPARGA